MPLIIIVFLGIQLLFISEVNAISDKSGSYQGSYQRTFTNKNFQNTTDFANSSLGPTISAQRANPAFYKSQMQTQGFGPPPPPPQNIPLNEGYILLIGGILLTGYWYFFKMVRKAKHV